jgi:hypothetical protein
MGKVIADDEIVAAAYRNGCSGDALPIAVAVALAESQGNTQAHNPKPPDDSWGLWQINYYGSLRAGRTAAYGPPESMWDPDKCAAAARSVSGNWKDFGPWSTFDPSPKHPYNNSAYRLYLPRAYKAVALFQMTHPSENVRVNPNPSGAQSAARDAAEAAADIGNAAADAAGAAAGLVTAPLEGIAAVGALASALLSKGTWVRVLQVVGGAAVVVTAVALVNRDAIAPVVGAVAGGPAGAAVASAATSAT